jgi:hypothetical protein
MKDLTPDSLEQLLTYLRTVVDDKGERINIKPTHYYTKENRMIDVMKLALEALEWGQPIIEDYGSKEQLQAHLSAKDALYKAIEADMYKNPDTGNPCEGWNPSDMAHRSGGLSVEQEPVAWLVSDAQGRYATIRDPSLYKEEVYEPLYTAPSRKEWVGLTDEEVGKYSDRLNGGDIAREVEAKLKERNT